MTSLCSHVTALSRCHLGGFYCHLSLCIICVPCEALHRNQNTLWSASHTVWLCFILWFMQGEECVLPSDCHQICSVCGSPFFKTLYGLIVYSCDLSVQCMLVVVCMKSWTIWPWSSVTMVRAPQLNYKCRIWMPMKTINRNYSTLHRKEWGVSLCLCHLLLHVLLQMHWVEGAWCQKRWKSSIHYIIFSRRLYAV